MRQVRVALRSYWLVLGTVMRLPREAEKEKLEVVAVEKNVQTSAGGQARIHDASESLAGRRDEGLAVSNAI